LSFESGGHLYGREVCANTWYAIGAMRLRQRRDDEAGDAFRQAMSRAPKHPYSLIGLALAEPEMPLFPENAPIQPTVDVAIGRAMLTSNRGEAARLVDDALAAAPAGSAGWLLPVEPLLNVSAAPDIWAPVLARLRTRAA
jgi:hypothetical protein